MMPQCWGEMRCIFFSLKEWTSECLSGSDGGRHVPPLPCSLLRRIDSCMLADYSKMEGAATTLRWRPHNLAIKTVLANLYSHVLQLCFHVMLRHMSTHTLLEPTAQQKMEVRWTVECLHDPMVVIWLMLHLVFNLLWNA
eukprot:1806646-Amphidinium_carterae.1